jgi:drug/metabolite transporter (DMT)-like permease
MMLTRYAMWQISSFVAMGCFAAMQLIFASLSRRGMSPAAVLLGVFGIAALLYAIHLSATRTPLPRAPGDAALVAAAAALSYIGNFLLLRAIAAAPNPGYAVAISGLQAAVVTVASIGVLGAEFSWIKAAGVVLCAVGVTLIVR